MSPSSASDRVDSIAESLHSPFLSSSQCTAEVVEPSGGCEWRFDVDFVGGIGCVFEVAPRRGASSLGSGSWFEVEPIRGAAPARLCCVRKAVCRSVAVGTSCNSLSCGVSLQGAVVYAHVFNALVHILNAPRAALGVASTAVIRMSCRRAIILKLRYTDPSFGCVFCGRLLCQHSLHVINNPTPSFPSRKCLFEGYAPHLTKLS